jgi:N utilization substance protein A
MKSEFEIAITQLSSDRNLSQEIILEAIQAALASAYKRNYGSNQNVSVTIDPRTGQAHVYVKKTVVEDVQDDRAEIPLAEAQTYKADAQPGELIDVEVKPRNFGRIAAQTAKQVIMQRIREAERDSVYLEYADRAGEIVNGVVRNIDARSQNVTLSLGKAEAVLPRSEQIPGEHYRPNQRVRVFLAEVERTGHGPQITASRTNRGLLRRLLELEVPEIFNGTVEIKAIAREPGSRSKIAVAALQAGVDPVGSCVGMRGVRIQNVVNELNGEKIDVVAWAPINETFIANALSPAKVVNVTLNEQEKTAKVVVPDRSLSLAIGKEGQNARLAAKLTGWRIDIKSETEAAEEAKRLAAEAEEAALRAKELEMARQAAAELLAEAQATLEEEQPAIAVAELAAAEPAAPEQAATEVALPAVAEVSEEEVVVEELPTEAPVVEEVVAPVESVELEPAVEPAAVEAAELVAPEAQPAVEPAAEEAVAPAQVEPLTEWGEEEEPLEEEEEGEEEMSEADRKKARDKKNRQRLLEFDERLGRVVARKRRKPSRKGIFEDDTGDWDS